MAPSLNVVPVDAPGISQAAEILRAGGLVAFPTETVYGLGADATSDRAVAAPSANRSGHVSATTAQHVAEDLEDRVDLVLDGGATIGGVESTIVGFENDTAIILRPGAISRQELEAVAGRVAATAGKTIASPGQLASHYAPRALLRLNVTEVYNDEALLAFGS